MSQPSATRAAVPNPNSSAPSKRRDQDVPPDLEPTVRPQHDPVAQPVPEERLVDLGQPELPRRPGVLDRAERAGPGPAGVAGQVDVVGAGLDDPGGDRPDAPARHELDPDPGRAG